MIAACYVMQLYCRRGETSGGTVFHARDLAEFTGRTHAACMRDAKRKGWRFCADGDVLCPTYCAKDRHVGESPAGRSAP